MNIINNNFFKRVYNKLTGIPYIISYSQTGEDIIIDFLIGAKKIKDFTYLDIGASRLNSIIHINFMKKVIRESV